MIIDWRENFLEFQKCWSVQKKSYASFCQILRTRYAFISHFMKLSLPGGVEPNLTFRCSNQLIQILSRTISSLISSLPMRTVLPEPSQMEALFTHFLHLWVGGGCGRRVASIIFVLAATAALLSNECHQLVAYYSGSFSLIF